MNRHKKDCEHECDCYHRGYLTGRRHGETAVWEDRVAFAEQAQEALEWLFRDINYSAKTLQVKEVGS